MRLKLHGEGARWHGIGVVRAEEVKAVFGVCSYETVSGAEKNEYRVPKYWQSVWWVSTE